MRAQQVLPLYGTSSTNDERSVHGCVGVLLLACIHKYWMLSEQEKLYVELKKILGRQPGPEVSEQLALYQDNLKHKVFVNYSDLIIPCGCK